MIKNKKDDQALSNEVLGISAVFNPFCSHISANRLGMFSNSKSQFQEPIKNGESPNIFSGYELFLNKYEINSGKVEDDVEILDIIPKYIFLPNSPLNKYVPEYYLIVRNLSDSTLDYYKIKKFQQLNNKFGYETKMLNLDKLKLNSFLKKDTKLYTSKNYDENNMLKFGANANVAFMTLSDNIEDAFRISDKLAEKLTPNGYETISIHLSPEKDFVLKRNTDNSDTYKFILDLGEVVDDSGILMITRKKETISLLNDFNELNINNINKILDKVYYTEKQAQVVEIDVFVTPKILKSLPKQLEQISVYHDAKIRSLKKIFEIYKKYKDTYKCSKKFNTLITDTIKYLQFHNIELKGIRLPKKKMILINKDTECELMINVTLKYPKRINLGSKLTGRDGAKGTISNIVPSSMMPCDENGITADIVIDPISIIARNNIGQSIEAYINRIASLVTNTNKNNSISINNQFNNIMDFLNDISPSYKNIIEQNCKTEEQKKDFLTYTYLNQLKIHIKASQKNINSELIKKLYSKYDSKISKVTYKEIDEFGNVKEIKTKDAVLIGNKFIYLLYNEAEISAVSIGPINAFLIPTRISKLDELLFPIKQQACKVLDEDNVRVLVNTLSPDIVYRIRALSTSFKGIETITNELLEADRPSDIDMFPITNKELAESDTIISVVHTIANSFGLTLQDVKLDKKDLEYYNQAVLTIENEKNYE